LYEIRAHTCISALLPHTHFWLRGSGPPRPLHSFPTRRSSDLEQARSLIQQADALGEPPEDPLLVFSVLYAFWVEDREHQQRIFGDRKSTRLNSSHVKISYAVFCLKKKTST